MRKFCIRIFDDLDFWYNHYLSDKFINKWRFGCDFKYAYPLRYNSRRFDKPAEEYKNGACCWRLDDNCHRVGRPAWIYSDGRVGYYENGERVK